jgi:peptidoglycan/LPS O-acetylase OafA/YrhL
MIISKNKYIKQIDGLRGISIISVVLYHFFPEIFKGGFIGVDIFFVISGFVISKILIEEFNLNKTISIKNFYVKRIKRIFPAFFLVIFSSSIFSYFILLPNYLVDFSKSSLASVFFSSNFYFFFTNQSYAAISSNFKPLLHLWSLSVEEQFYVFFPVFILIILKFFKNNYFLALIISLLILLYIFSNILENLYYGSSFYLLPTRAVQFLIGCLVAYLYLKEDENLNFQILISPLFYLSTITIIIFILFITNENLYPSYYSLPVIFGSAILIYSTKFKILENSFLSSYLLVWFGKISYSLYLWHYPIFVYANYLDLLNSRLSQIIFLILSVIFAYISYNFYEKKFRYSYSFSKTLIISVILCFFIFLYSYLSITSNGFEKRVPEILSKNYDSIIYELKDDKGEICYDRKKDFCHLNKGEDKLKVAVVGDSHTALITTKMSQTTDYEIISMNNTGCYFLPNFSLFNIGTNIEYERCDSQIQLERLKKLDSLENHIIIVGGRLPLYLTGKKFDNLEGGKEGNKFKDLKQKNLAKNYKDEIRKPILKLAEKNKVLIIYPIPELGWDIKREILKNTNKNVLKIKKEFNENFPIISTSFDVFKKRNKDSFKVLDSIEHKNILRVFPHKLFCDSLIKDRCVANDKKNLFYIDTDHLTDYANGLVVEMIFNEINKVEK